MTVIDNPGAIESSVVGLSIPEQLAALRADAGGAAAGIHTLNERLAGLYELLEIELEDAPGAALYLQDSKRALEQISALSKRLLGAVAAPADMLESLDLVRLAEAADGRLRRIGKAGYAIADVPTDCSTMINGNLFLLQQLVLDLPALFDPAEAVPLSICKASLEGAPAVALCLGTGAEEAVLDGGQLFEKPVSPEIEDRLSTLAGIAAVHGGCVRFGRGADPAYAILIPQPEADAAGFASADNDDALRGSETILLVDDESMIWDVVIDMLQSLGYTVLLAANGRECVEIYGENIGKIELVLLDMIMPEMNGRDAFHELKKLDENVRVLLQSGYVAEAEARDVLDSGACGFMRKPYRMVDLAAQIREVLA